MPEPTAPPPDRRQLAAAEGAADTLSSRSAVMLPARLLDADEVIVLLLKPSPLYIVLMPMRSLIVIALVVLLLGQLQARGIPLGLSHADLVLAGMGLIGARLFWQVLEWLNQIYILTDRRVVRVRGVINVRVFERPLADIRRADLLRPMILRVFGLGTIGFATVSDRFHEAYWLMIAGPQEVHETLNATLRRYRG
jgi:uncharacterized membrane protein YdbT with pleckstrin-like domain